MYVSGNPPLFPVCYHYYSTKSSVFQKEQASETFYLYKQTEQQTQSYGEYCNLAESLSHNSSMNRLVYLK